MFVPTKIKPLRFTLLIESIFSVYRSLDYFTTKRRFIVLFRIIIEIVISASSIVIHYIYLVPVTASNDLVCYYSNVLNSLFPVLFAGAYSRKYNRLLLLIEKNHSNFANDVDYHTNMSKRDRLIKIGCGIYLPVVMFTVLYGSYVKTTEIENVPLAIIYNLNSRVCDCRNVFEYVALYSVLYVISQQLECITRVVRKINTSELVVNEQSHIANENSSQMRQDTRDFEELSAVFSNIVECCKICNKIYGIQLVFMLGWATTYCILFLYTTAFLSIKGFHDLSQLLGSMWRLTVFFLLLLLISHIAQKKQNNARELRQQLGKLLISYVGNDAEYKPTKDFLRLVSTQSVHTKSFGSIAIDMTLIPSVIMFITSNTVIALQFSNIM